MREVGAAGRLRVGLDRLRFAATVSHAKVARLKSMTTKKHGDPLATHSFRCIPTVKAALHDQTFHLVGVKLAITGRQLAIPDWVGLQIVKVVEIDVVRVITDTLFGEQPLPFVDVKVQTLAQVVLACQAKSFLALRSRSEVAGA